MKENEVVTFFACVMQRPVGHKEEVDRWLMLLRAA
jgi:hypothetical protein